MLTTEQINDLLEILMSSDDFLSVAEDDANEAERRAEDAKDYAKEAVDSADTAFDYAEEALESAQSAQGSISSAREELGRAQDLLKKAQEDHNTYAVMLNVFFKIQKALLELPQWVQEELRHLFAVEKQQAEKAEEVPDLAEDDLKELESDESEEC